MSQADGLTPEQKSRYEEALANGSGPNLALIIATKQAPSMDRKDERWRLTNESAEWRKDVPQGKYQSGLARYPGDPTAFVQSRGEAKKLAAQRGLTILDRPANHDNPRQRSRK